MTPEQFLKRIEEKHQEGCISCRNEQSCDVVKLARALVAIYTFPGVQELLAPKESLCSTAMYVERVLSEVAGGEK